MTPKNDNANDDDDLGMLDEAASLDTTSLGVLGETAQVSVSLPQDEDDDLVDDAVVDGEIPAELIIEEAPVVDESVVDRLQADLTGIVIELPAEASTDPEPAAVEEVIIGEIVESSADDAAPDTAAPARAVDAEPAVPASAVSTSQPRKKSAKPTAPEPEAEKPAPSATAVPKSASDGVPSSTAASAAAPAPKSAAALQSAAVPKADAAPKADASPKGDPAPKADAAPKDAPAPKASAAARPATKSAPADEKPVAAPSATSAWIAAAMKQETAAASEPKASAPASARETEEAKNDTVNAPEPEKSAPAETAVVPRAAAARPETQLTAKRLGDQQGQSARESADLLTADRLLDPHQVAKPEPEGAWSHFLYSISGRRINIGDGRKARERKALTARITAPLDGRARFVPVLSRKGGVGKTTITALLGMALADARDDRVIAVDANPDRGTLADRIVRHHSKSVRDLVRIHDDVQGYHDISAIVARDATRLDVLASDADPRVAEAFSDEDYRDVAGVAARYYSLVLTDTGTGIVHSVMGATLDLADQLVIVSGLSVDEARLASETLTWLETNGYERQARNAVIVLNQSTPGSPLVRLNELESHFGTRAKAVVRMPYDAQIAGGGAIVFQNLQPETRTAARDLAALLVEGLRVGASV